jgi:hypothetical protein
MKDKRIGGWSSFSFKYLLDGVGEKAERTKAVDSFCGESDYDSLAEDMAGLLDRG